MSDSRVPRDGSGPSSGDPRIPYPQQQPPQPPLQPQPPLPQPPLPQPYAGGLPNPQPGPDQPKVIAPGPEQVFPAAQQWPAPAPSWQQPPVQSGAEPNWSALADQEETRVRKRRRLALIGGLLAVVIVGGAGAALLLSRGGKPAAHPLAGPTASASVSTSAGPSGDGSTSIAPVAGTTPLELGSDVKVGTVPGFSAKVLSLFGDSGSFGHTLVQLVDVRKSFTVSAWVLNNSADGTRSAVSEGSGGNYAFTLGRFDFGGHNAWNFKVQIPGGGTVDIMSKGTSTVGQWTLLTGEYDASARQIRFYVNGVEQSSASVSGIEPVAGSLQIGRDHYQSNWTDDWDGGVSGIQLWSQALSAADVGKLAQGPGATASVPSVASWLTTG